MELVLALFAGLCLLVDGILCLIRFNRDFQDVEDEQ